MTFGLRKSANRLGAVGPARANYFCGREFLNYFIFLLLFLLLENSNVELLIK